MTIIVFSLIVLAFCGIIVYANKAWNRVEMKEKMEEIEEIYQQEKEIKEFKNAHEGDLNKKRENINNFIKE